MCEQTANYETAERRLEIFVFVGEAIYA